MKPKKGTFRVQETYSVGFIVSVFFDGYHRRGLIKKPKRTVTTLILEVNSEDRRRPVEITDFPKDWSTKLTEEGFHATVDCKARILD